jgi:PKD repeat protein
VVPAGANLGWPCYEGAARQDGYEPLAPCQALYTRGTAEVRMPLVAYSTINGASSTGGAFYTGAAYPAEYQGAYFYGDFVKGWIRYLRVDAGNTLIAGPTDFAIGTGGPVDIQLGPDQALYYLAINGGELRRVRYLTAMNVPPTASASATPTAGSAPLSVQFSSMGSVSPSGDALRYTWDFGDGTPRSNAPDPQHVYATNGTYTATLTVDDGRGGTGTDTVTVSVGSRPPTATISAPSPSSLVQVGDVVAYAGGATDPEDGTIAASRLSWQVILHHCPGGTCHNHSFVSGSGSGGSFIVPDHGDESYFELRLTATDSGGLTDTASVTILPRTTQLTLSTVPAGLRVAYDGVGATAPLTRTTIVGSTHTIQVPSPQERATFERWSDGGAQQHNVTVGTADAEYIATFTAPPAGCSPRPGVRITTSKAGPGQLNAVIAAQTSSSMTTNSLISVRFTRIDNAAARLDGVPVSAGQTVALPGGTQHATLSVTRQAPGQNPGLTTTVEFEVIDVCGAWLSFVGGGPGAF